MKLKFLHLTTNAAKNWSGVKLRWNHFVLWNQFHLLCVFFTTLLVLPRTPFLCFPFPRLYILDDCVSSSAATSRIRKNDVPDDATPVFGTDPYCQLLLAYVPISVGSRESYEVPFGRSRVDSHISSSPYEFCFNFRVSHLEVKRSVKLM